MTTLKLYHGTTEDKVSKILKEGIKSPIQDSKWYMLADNFGSALYHCNADIDTKAVVLEIELKLPELEDDVLWKGYPVLYPEYRHDNDEISWFALNEIIKPEFITKIHEVDHKSFLAQKNKGFDDLESYKSKVKKNTLKSKNKNKRL